MEAIDQTPQGGTTPKRSFAQLANRDTQPRAIAMRTQGRMHGPVKRLLSPNRLGSVTKPFVFLDYFDFQSIGDAMFPMHPHSGIATTTVLLEGQMRYEDTTGARGQLEAGSVEWMHAGKGIWHDGIPLRGQRLRGYQLWLALPQDSELAAPVSQYLTPAEVPVVNGVRVILGAHAGQRSAVAAPDGIQYLHASLRDGEVLTLPPPAGHTVAWLHVNTGALLTGADRVADELVVFAEGEQSIELMASGATDFVIGTARKHLDPLVLGTYSVHTTRAALLRGEQEIARLGEQLRASGRAV
ncbi:pirin family protein [Caldimonas sp. KR1-144]|uniref:pirin family protein n=1 Tax=Caldimonas sp. KR1-144 TaxID=3400911 RepID=UPI003C0D03C9